jgi:HEPN domain-containing protein
MAIYHTQQCAEKALKAYLVFREQEVDKTHNLDVLNSQCLALDPSFEAIREAALFLRPFATAYRYPEGELEPSPSKVAKAIETAKTVLDFVNKTIQMTS